MGESVSWYPRTNRINAVRGTRLSDCTVMSRRRIRSRWQRQSRQSVTRLSHLVAQRIKIALVRRRIDPHDHVHRRQHRQPLESDEFPQPPFEAIAFDRIVFVLRDDHPHAHRRTKGSDCAHVHDGGAHTLPL